MLKDSCGLFFEVGQAQGGGVSLGCKGETAMIAAAVSGGVDSLYALASLRLKGEDVLAIHGIFHEGGAQSPAIEGLWQNCARLSVPLHVADLRAAFRERVMRPFAERYAACETPNPCAMCNARIKFGLLWDKAEELGAGSLATGHYARSAAHPRYGWALVPPADPRKDQSYFLSLVPAERLKRALFPLEGVRKDEARAFVASHGLSVPLPRESQEICFVPNDDYRSFLDAFGLALPGPGDVALVDEEGACRVIGCHQGLWRYTEGQRRGLGIAFTEPLYVLGKDRAKNTLLVGSEKQLRQPCCEAGEINLLVDPALWPKELFVRIRYRQKAMPARVELTEGNAMRIAFAEPQPLGAPGQVAAVFDAEGALLGGGILRGRAALP